MARIKARSVLIEQNVINADEVQRLPPTPSEDYFPCAVDDEVIITLKEVASTMKKSSGKDLTAYDIEEALTLATDTTESEDDVEYIIKLRDAIEVIKGCYREILNEEKKIVKEKGGLYVMGTNRHESSRIDAQLRGRAGRQGDPGSSRFFLSFQDDMFVIFGGDGLQNILNSFRVSDDMPVEAPQVTDALDNVQIAVEEKYREIREQILQFDDVLNEQRKVIYERRQNILFGNLEETMDLVKKYHKLSVLDIVKAQTTDSVLNIEKVMEKVGQFFPGAAPLITVEDISGLDVDGVAQFITLAVDEYFESKAAALDKKAKSEGKLTMSLARSAKYIILVTMDNAWSEHLQNMEDLKEAVVLRKFQNLDPVAEYKSEAFNIFKGLEGKMRFNGIYSLWQSI